MITTALLFVIYGIVWVVTAPIRALADVTLSSSFATSVTTAMTYASRLNHFLPLGTLLALIGIILTFEGGLVTYKVIMWIVRRVPAQG